MFDNVFFITSPLFLIKIRYICVKMIPNFSKEANTNYVCLISNCDQVGDLCKEYAGRTRPRSTSGLSATCSITVLIFSEGSSNILYVYYKRRCVINAALICSTHISNYLVMINSSCSMYSLPKGYHGRNQPRSTSGCT